jgi:hypothetical protein
VLGRLERLNDAYARGEIELDELEQRTAEVIDRGHETSPAPPRPVRPATRNRWLLPCGVAAGVILVIGAIASSVPNSKTVPDVVGMYPQEAIAAINAAGLTTNSHGGIGDDERQGFVVCETVPAAGARLDPDVAEVEIFSRRDCEPTSPLARPTSGKWQAARHNR